MQIFKNLDIDFVSKQKSALIASTVLVVGALIMLYIKGFSLGIDFTGGVQVILNFDQNVEISDVRTAITNNGFEDAEVKTFGEKKISISLKAVGDIDNEKLINNIQSIAQSEIKNAKLVEAPSVQNISGKMSHELVGNSVAAIIFALVLIALYIIVRFSTSNIVIGIVGFAIDYAIFKFFGQEYIGYYVPLFVFYPIWKAGFAFGAVVAVFHDVVIALSLIEVFNVELSATVIAALLTIIGYSLNDTIVVFDRMRENFGELKAGDFTLEKFRENVNHSINTTLNRTVVTSLTTFFVVFILSIFGGESLYPFSITLVFGVVVGTYSSIFIAAPIMMNRYVAEMEERKVKELEVEKNKKKNPHDPEGQGIAL
jgi:preprotein translocase subunit SecF